MMRILRKILALWMAGQLGAAAYVGQSLEEVTDQTELFRPPPVILKAVEERVEKELPDTLLLMGLQDGQLVFFCFYEGVSVREFYVNLTLNEALTVLAKSGINQASEQRPDHLFFSGPHNCADYYPKTGNLCVFSAAHGLRVQVYNEQLKKAALRDSPLQTQAQ